MPEDYDADRELVSALADGELRGEELSRAMELLGRSDQALASWRSYHVTSDALRCADMELPDGNRLLSRVCVCSLRARRLPAGERVTRCKGCPAGLTVRARLLGALRMIRRAAGGGWLRQRRLPLWRQWVGNWSVWTVR